MRSNALRHTALVSVVFFAALPFAASAASIGLVEQGTGAVASATADETTTSDPSIAYYNPAGMVLVQGNQVEGALTYYDIHSSFSGTDNAVGRIGSTTNSASGFETSTALPDTFAVFSLPWDGIKIGFTLTSPDGTREKFAPDFTGDPQANEANVTQVNVAAPIAIPLGHGVSIGFAPSIDWMQAIVGLTQNYPAFDALTTGGRGVAGSFHGQNYAFGYDAGAMYQYDDATRFSINYRSKITHDLKGTETLEVGQLGGLLKLVGLSVPGASSADTKLVTPASISFGAFHQLTPQIAIMANALWTEWQGVPGLVIGDPAIASPFVLNGSIDNPFHYRNTWTVGVATQYTPIQLPKLRLTAGVGYDETPITTEYRNNVLPDNNRIMLGFGGDYHLTQHIKLSGSYGHYFLAGAAMNYSRKTLLANGSTADSNSGTLSGLAKESADVFSTALTVAF